MGKRPRRTTRGHGDGAAPVLTPDAVDVTGWPLDRVIDHVVASHHTYERAILPMIQAHATQLARAHGNRIPDLSRIAEGFDRFAADLTRHMAKEEGILFPFIRVLIEARSGRDLLACWPFDTIRDPIRLMDVEHEQAIGELRALCVLMRGIQLAPDDDEAWRECCGALAEFEAELRHHLHIESTMLFPAATRLEEALG